MVLPGLIAGASLVVPQRRPARYANVSAPHTNTSAYNGQVCGAGCPRCNCISAVQAGRMTRTPLSSLSVVFSRVGAAPNEKCLSQTSANTHQMQPATIVIQPIVSSAEYHNAHIASAHNATS